MQTVKIWLLLSWYIQLTVGHAYVSVKFLTLYNPQLADFNHPWCPPKCAYIFTLCLDISDGNPQDLNVCVFGKPTSSGEVIKKASINFDNKIGQLDNPVIWMLYSWPGEVKLKIKVADTDGDKEMRIGTFNKIIDVTPSLQEKGSKFTFRDVAELTLEVKVYCGQDYYGFNCSLYCEPPKPSSEHYICDRDQGTKICDPGWTGATCNVSIDDCVGKTCLNGASCQDLHQAFKCVCPNGYEGRFCEREIDECLIPDMCVHGHCAKVQGTPECTCKAGYTGKHCEEEINECASSPCVTGVCFDYVNKFECACVSGYTGLVCEEDIDECYYKPCAITGTCVNFPGGYRCDCMQGYRGWDCSKDVDECDRAPCQNKGTCENYLGGYSCVCPSGFTGQDCEHDINECGISDNCQNGASCVNFAGSYSCACLSGYGGKFCEKDLDECEENPCNNSGRCQNLPGNYSCDCLQGYTGTHCEADIDECDLGICKNEATCMNKPGSFACFCGPYWTGLTCEENVDECLRHPCQNGGTCLDVTEGFHCYCPRGFLGRVCEEDLNECDLDEACFNNGICNNTFGGFSCDCQRGWQGQKCEEDVNECEIIRCYNLGACVNTNGGFRCECPVNWSGVKCETDVDECALPVRPCRNNATCINMVGNFHCECAEGWTGALCDEDVDECQKEPTLCTIRGNFTHDNSTDFNDTTVYHKRCMNTAPGFVCLCPEGWTGQWCDVDVDECELQAPSHTKALDGGDGSARNHESQDPVKNTSHITTDLEMYTTPDTYVHSATTIDNLTRGYEGNVHSGSLHTDMPPLLQSPACLHGGVCSNTIGSFSCSCSRNWSGARCEVDVSACEAQGLCGQHGTCVFSEDSVHCQCEPNWMGPKCDLMSPCHPNPCQHGAVCHVIEELASFLCQCAQGWSGVICDQCGNGTCYNEGICMDDGSETEKRCQCLEGWTGASCESNTMTSPPQNVPDNSSRSENKTLDYRNPRNINDSHEESACAQLQCPANSTCHVDELTSKPRCACRDGNCDEHNADCRITPCENYGICLNINGTWSCECQGMWSGFNCSVVDLALPFYLACRITSGTRWMVNKGLKQLLEDTNLYRGKQLTVAHKADIGTSEDGEIVTSIHPVITVDGRKLSDDEIAHVLNKVSYKFKHYLYCPLFLDAVRGKFTFINPPLHSLIPNWYPGLAIASVLLFLLILALIVIKCRRSYGCCSKKQDYHLRSVHVSNSIRNEVYTDAIFAISQLEEQNKSASPHQDDWDTAALVRSSAKKTVISIQNPLYASLEEMHEAVKKEEEEEEASNNANQAVEESKSSNTSEEDVSDGQPTPVEIPEQDEPKKASDTEEDGYSVPKNNTCVETGKVDATAPQLLLSRDTAPHPKLIYMNMKSNKQQQKKKNNKSWIVNYAQPSKGDNPRYSSKGSEANGDSYVNMDVHQQIMGEGKPTGGRYSGGKGGREKQLSHRRRRAAEAEYQKYRNLPYIDDPACVEAISRGQTLHQS